MKEILMVTPPPGEGGNDAYVEDLTFYFLERGRVNNSGGVYSYIWYYYIELRDKNNNKIILDDSQFSASSQYTTNYQVSNLNTLNTSSWCTADGNNGNPNKSCWFKISGINREVFQIDLIGSTTGISRLISVEADGIEIARVDRTHLANNLYPLVGNKYSTLKNYPICEIVL